MARAAQPGPIRLAGRDASVSGESLFKGRGPLTAWAPDPREEPMAEPLCATLCHTRDGKTRGRRSVAHA